jgi:hypothetical protein
MKAEEKLIQLAKDWLCDNDYDDRQYVTKGGNSPHGVNHEGFLLEEVLADFAEAVKRFEKEETFNTSE